MTEPAPPDDETTWRRRFASRANNRAWQLSEQASRTRVEDAEMLDAAPAAAHLWEPIGTPRTAALGWLLLAQVHALLDHPAEATRHAHAAFDWLAAHEPEPWETALAHAVRAHAAYRAGDFAAHRADHALATRLVAALPDAEDRAILEATLRVIPSPV